jgi:hypothetical protein
LLGAVGLVNVELLDAVGTGQCFKSFQRHLQDRERGN